MSQSEPERRKATSHQILGTVSGLLNIVLMTLVLLGGLNAFYELRSSVIILNNTMSKLEASFTRMNEQINQIDERVRKVEIRTR